jgi:NAD(P)H-dependent FMN reductase
MTNPIRIAVISGSLRDGSYNTALARYIAKHMESMGAVEIDEISLKELDLPMFSEDLEAENFPEKAIDLKKRLIASDGMLMTCPEYNGSITGALKNAIDWASRPRPDEKQLECFSGKVGALAAASPGALGGLRGMRHVRQILAGIQVLMTPAEYALGSAHQAFDDNGDLKDDKAASMAKNVGSQLVETTQKLKG